MLGSARCSRELLLAASLATASLVALLAAAPMGLRRRHATVITPFPFNTHKTEQEMAFADDGTFVFCSAKPDTAVAAGDELDIYIATYDAKDKTFSAPVNMGLGVNSAPDPTNPLRGACGEPGARVCRGR